MEFAWIYAITKIKPNQRSGNNMKRKNWIEIKCDGFLFYYLSKVFISSFYSAISSYIVDLTFKNFVWKESFMIICDDNKSFSPGMCECGWCVCFCWKFRRIRIQDPLYILKCSYDFQLKNSWQRVCVFFLIIRLLKQLCFQFIISVCCCCYFKYIALVWWQWFFGLNSIFLVW